MRAADFGCYLEIEVGGKSSEQLLQEIRGEFGPSDMTAVADLMSHRSWQPGKKELVKFARARIVDLGFHGLRTTPAMIWERIAKLGHSVCAPADAAHIRLHLRDQSKGDCFWTAMTPILNSYRVPNIFCVSRLQERKVLGATPLQEDVIDTVNELVFRVGQ